MFYIGMIIIQPIIEVQIGLYVPLAFASLSEWLLLFYIITGATIIVLIPTPMAYRRSITDRMTVRN